MTGLPAYLFLPLGLLAGGVHFAALSWDADLLTQGGSAIAVAGLRLGRMILTIVLLVAAALQGWPALLATAGGFLGARQVMLYLLGPSA